MLQVRTYAPLASQADCSYITLPPRHFQNNKLFARCTKSLPFRAYTCSPQKQGNKSRHFAFTYLQEATSSSKNYPTGVQCNRYLVNSDTIRWARKQVETVHKPAPGHEPAIPAAIASASLTWQPLQRGMAPVAAAFCSAPPSRRHRSGRLDIDATIRLQSCNIRITVWNGLNPKRNV